jgi:hypothetical protein
VSKVAGECGWPKCCTMNELLKPSGALKRRIELFSPKIKRRLRLFSWDSHDAWLLLEAGEAKRSGAGARFSQAAFHLIDISVVRAALFDLLAEGRVVAPEIDFAPLGPDTAFRRSTQ